MRVTDRHDEKNVAKHAVPTPLITLLATAAVVVIGAVLFRPGNGDSNSAKLQPKDSAPPKPAAAPVSKSISVANIPKPVPTAPAKSVTPPNALKTPEPTKPKSTETVAPAQVTPAVTPAPIPPQSKQISLQQARASYEGDRAEFVKLITAHLLANEAKARSEPDEKLVKKATAASEAFEKNGQLPPDAPVTAIEKMVESRAVVEKALSAELQAAVASQVQSSIESANQELTKFMATESSDVGNVIQRYPKSWFRLINVNSDLALGVPDQAKNRGAAVVQTKDDPGNQGLHWRIRYPGTHYSRLQNRVSTLVLNVPAHDRNQGAHLIQWNDDGNSNNFFELQYRGSYYHIRSLFSGHLVSIANAKRDENRQVIQWGGHGGPDQKWRLVRMLDDEKEVGATKQN